MITRVPYFTGQLLGAPRARRLDGGAAAG